MSELVLSNSTIQTYKSCKRHYWLKYHRQLNVPKKRHNPMTVAELGTRVHTILEAFYGYDVPFEVSMPIIYEAAKEEYPHHAEELDDERKLTTIMVEGWLEWAAEKGIDHAFEVVSTEQTVTYNMQVPGSSDNIVLMGKLDQQVRRKFDDALMFRDWKTCGNFSKADDLIRDEQFRFYSMLWSLITPEGERVGGGLYTQLRRSNQSARSKGPYYQQIAVSYNRDDLKSMWYRTWEVANEINNFTRRLNDGEDHRAVAYPHPSMSCSWSCPFVNVCHMADDGSRFEDALSNLFEPRNPYEYYGSEQIDLVKEAVGIKEESP